MTVPLERVACRPSEVGQAGWRRRLAETLDERGSAAVILDGSLADWTVSDTEAIRSIPAVTIGVARGAGALPAAAAACDLLLAIGARGDGLDAPQAEVDAWIDARCAELARAPLALTVLSRTLRLAEGRPAAEALLAESSAYSVLQEGPEHKRWLHDAGTTRPRTRR